MLNKGMTEVTMVSIIIPSYNREELIERSVRSVLNQTYKDLEVIVVDDCSTDNTMQVLKGIDDERLRVYQLEKNSGACVARNKGIELAKGEYIAFQDSDDEFLPTKIEKQIEILKRDDVDVCVCQIDRVGYKSSYESGLYPDIEEGIIDFDILLKRSTISTQMIVGKRKVFEDIQFDNEMPRFQDFDLVIRIGKKYNVYFLKEPLCKVYLQNDSITKSNVKGIKAYERIIEKYSDIWPSHRLAYCNILQNLGAAYTLEGEHKPSIYSEILKYNFSIKILLKYILSKLHLYKYFI